MSASLFAEIKWFRGTCNSKHKDRSSYSKGRLVLTLNPPEPLRLSEQICEGTLRSLCCISQALKRKHKLATCQIQIQGYISGQESVSREIKADICLLFFFQIQQHKGLCRRNGHLWREEYCSGKELGYELLLNVFSKISLQVTWRKSVSSAPSPLTDRGHRGSITVSSEMWGCTDRELGDRGGRVLALVIGRNAAAVLKANGLKKAAGHFCAVLKFQKCSFPDMQRRRCSNSS